MIVGSSEELPTYGSNMGVGVNPARMFKPQAHTEYMHNSHFLLGGWVGQPKKNPRGDVSPPCLEAGWSCYTPPLPHAELKLLEAPPVCDDLRSLD